MSKKHKEESKTLQLSDAEVSELSFYAMNARKSEIEMDWWARATEGMRNQILARFSVPAGATINWDRVYSTGQISYTPAKDEPKLEITAKPE